MLTTPTPTLARATAQHSPLNSLNFAALKIKDAVCDRFRTVANGVRPDVNTQWPDVRIYAHLTTDSCSLYIDTSGEPLFKRGWRVDKGDAPLKETLAAAMIAASGWLDGEGDLQPLYDPCCGSGGMFVQSEEFILSHGGKLGDVAIYGQEANPTTWRLAAMNLAIRGIDFNLGREPADTFTRDQFPDLRADFILANPPFNISDWWHASLTGDARWHYGDPPAGNANYAWLQHMLHHLRPGVRNIPLLELRKALIGYATTSGRRPSLEYALIANVNDSDVERSALVKFCRGLLVHVNLIPVNPVAETGFKRASAERVEAFQRGLHVAGIEVSIRAERGTDIDAACGQLRQRAQSS